MIETESEMAQWWKAMKRSGDDNRHVRLSEHEQVMREFADIHRRLQWLTDHLSDIEERIGR